MLFLSPHLDDAILSCPAYMQRLLKQGREVRIATVFTEGGAGAEEEYRKRRREDRRAARELGVAAIHLGFTDAPFRSPRYRDFCGIAFGRAREYPATCRLVAEAIARLIRRLRPERVLAPLAVGNHVDHRLVRDASLAVASPEELLFYEDRPYAFIREQVQHVLGRNLGARPPRFWDGYFEASYVRTYRGRTSRARIVHGWSEAPPFKSGYRLRPEFTLQIRPGELARALPAIREYRSQLPDLFADDAELERIYRTVPETLYRISSLFPCPAS